MHLCNIIERSALAKLIGPRERKPVNRAPVCQQSNSRSVTREVNKQLGFSDKNNPRYLYCSYPSVHWNLLVLIVGFCQTNIIQLWNFNDSAVTLHQTPTQRLWQNKRYQTHHILSLTVATTVGVCLSKLREKTEQQMTSSKTFERCTTDGAAISKFSLQKINV